MLTHRRVERLAMTDCTERSTQQSCFRTGQPPCRRCAWAKFSRVAAPMYVADNFYDGLLNASQDVAHMQAFLSFIFLVAYGGA
ncbi:hypothetical protein C8Q73DRAFT_318449 [Cubamyces lactineus]|nr:hypothetical protein C8Q73DRAFT_318449 [Cubamyces lactineus]